MADPPICECHSLPKTWRVDRRKKAGGYWRCLEHENELARVRYAKNPEPKRARNARGFRRRYDTNPVWRIEHNLKRCRELRRAALDRGRSRLEELRG